MCGHAATKEVHTQKARTDSPLPHSSILVFQFRLEGDSLDNIVVAEAEKAIGLSLLILCNVIPDLVSVFMRARK